MARRATNPEIIAAMNVLCDRDAEVTADALAAVAARLQKQRDADYEEFDFREEMLCQYSKLKE